MEKENDDSDDFKCPYCGEDFDSENEKGSHISKNHVDTEKKIPKPESSMDKKTSLTEEWKGEEDE